MSVFNKVVSRVRDFFLEPDGKAAPAKPVTPASPAASSPALKPLGKGPDKSDAFEWEPPPTPRSDKRGTAPASPPLVSWSSTPEAAPAKAPFSPRNFSTEELQRSSISDIVAAVDARGKAHTAPLPERAAPGGPGEPPAALTAHLLEELAKSTPAPPPPNPVRPYMPGPASSTTAEISTNLVEEIPRPKSRPAPEAENPGFGSMLREAAQKAEDLQTPELPAEIPSRASETSLPPSPRSLAGIETAPPPFALEHDSTLTTEIGQVDFSIRSAPASESAPTESAPPEDLGVNTAEIDRHLLLSYPPPVPPKPPESRNPTGPFSPSRSIPPWRVRSIGSCTSPAASTTRRSPSNARTDLLPDQRRRPRSHAHRRRHGPATRLRLHHPYYRDRALMLPRHDRRRDAALGGRRQGRSQQRRSPDALHWGHPKLNVIGKSSCVGTQFLQGVGAAEASWYMRARRPPPPHRRNRRRGRARHHRRRHHQRRRILGGLNTASIKAARHLLVEDNGYAISTSPSKSRPRAAPSAKLVARSPTCT
jgi:hypothetical protein